MSHIYLLSIIGTIELLDLPCMSFGLVEMTPRSILEPSGHSMKMAYAELWRHGWPVCQACTIWKRRFVPRGEKGIERSGIYRNYLRVGEWLTN
jgi:hypothetical protein